MVRILFPSLIVKVTGEKETQVEARTLGEAVERLVERYGESFEKAIFDRPGEINRYLRFYIRGRPVQEHYDLQTRLEEGDEIVLLIIISGG
jgi:molybdopterin converting factor small subunit